MKMRKKLIALSVAFGLLAPISGTIMISCKNEKSNVEYQKELQNKWTELTNLLNSNSFKEVESKLDLSKLNALKEEYKTINSKSNVSELKNFIAKINETTQDINAQISKLKNENGNTSPENNSQNDLLKKLKTELETATKKLNMLLSANESKNISTKEEAKNILNAANKALEKSNEKEYKNQIQKVNETINKIEEEISNLEKGPKSKEFIKLRELREKLINYLNSNLSDFAYKDLRAEIKELIQKQESVSIVSNEKEIKSAIMQINDIFWIANIKKSILDKQFLYLENKPKSELDVKFLAAHDELSQALNTSIFENIETTNERNLLNKYIKTNLTKISDVEKQNYIEEVKKTINSLLNKYNNNNNNINNNNDQIYELNRNIEQLKKLNQIENNYVIDKVKLLNLLNKANTIKNEGSFAKKAILLESLRDSVSEFLEFYLQLSLYLRIFFDKNNDIIKLLPADSQTKIDDYLDKIKKITEKNSQAKWSAPTFDEYISAFKAQEEIFKIISSDLKSADVNILEKLTNNLKEIKKQKKNDYDTIVTSYLKEKTEETITKNESIIAKKSNIESQNIIETFVLLQKLELEFAYINWTELNLITKIKNKLELLIKINKIDSNEEAKILKPWTDSLNSSKKPEIFELENILKELSKSLKELINK
ncbi:P75 protein precursor [Metamycoplasma hominis]|uniref:P75 protein precursor n=4 Tax=Metamycoplasma hominis TaxID=2098 RepID=UPI00158D792C|nr:P75 protein precursor [Metamycoplasma hominis]QKX31503.1 P75 protein precursor [Metamycoplasma hominis]